MVSGCRFEVMGYNSTPAAGPVQAIEENNLPPNVRITMIAVDEPSARRIAEQSIALTNATNEVSLATLEAELVDSNLNFSKFESVVSIGPAKWSSQ